MTDHARNRFCAGLLALALTGCSSAVQSRVYRPEPMPASVSWNGRVPADVTTSSADGLTLRGYYWAPPTPGGDVILYFHGQSGNRYIAAQEAAPLADGGGLLVASYRGYGDNPGAPSEAGIYQDARAFLALARTLAPDSRIYVLGYSLGAAPALHVAAEEKVAGVVTIGAFASLKEVAPRLARGLLRDQFDNRATIARVDEPILLLHGTADERIPFEQARALQAAAPNRMRLLRLEGGGHGVDFAILAPMIWENIRQMPR